MKKSMIVAADLNGNIGYAGDAKLPWHISEDLKHFKEKTKGCPMIMGYNTFISLPGILPGRKHIVVSNLHFHETRLFNPQVIFEKTVENAILTAAKEQTENIWIIGGAQIYDFVLKNNLIDEIYLTEVQTKLTGDNLVGIDLEFIKTNFNVIDFTAPKPTSSLAFYFKHLKRK